MNMRIKFFMQFCLTLFTAFLLASSVFAAKKSNEQSLDKIIAIVDESVITQSELDQAMQSMRKQMAAANMPLPSEAELRKHVLDQLIDRKLELQVAAQSNIHVTDTELNQAIENIAHSNNITTADLYKQITQEGLSQSEYRKEIREEMTLQRVQQQEVGSKIVITPDEIKKFMRSKAPQQSAAAQKEYHVADILIALPDSPSAKDTETAQQTATDLLAKLRQNANTTSNAVTTDLGWRSMAEMPTAFANPVAKMKQNEFIGPIQTSNGFHLLHLLGVRDVAKAPTESSGLTAQQAGQMLYQRKMEQELKPWIAKLRSGAFINMHPDNP